MVSRSDQAVLGGMTCRNAAIRRDPMTELEQICENALYDVIRVLEDGKSIVRDVPTGTLYFKKTLDVYNTQVFTYLRDHRSRYVPSIRAFWKEGDRLVVIEELVQGRTLEELLGGEDAQ